MSPAPRPLVPIPSLDAVADGRVEPTTLPADVKQALARRAVTGLETLIPGLPGEVAGELAGRVVGFLLGRALTAAAGNGQPAGPAEPDRLLTPQQAAPILGVTPSWLGRHYKRFPFHRKLSRKQIKYSEQGLRRWLAAKRT